jgi:hypothetical protein
MFRILECVRIEVYLLREKLELLNEGILYFKSF